VRSGKGSETEGKKGYMREEKARKTLSASRKLNLATWTSSKHVGPTGPVEPPSPTSPSTPLFSVSLSLSLFLFVYLLQVPAIVKRLFYKSFRRETGDTVPFQASAATLVYGVFPRTGLWHERETTEMIREHGRCLSLSIL